MMRWLCNFKVYQFFLNCASHVFIILKLLSLNIIVPINPCRCHNDVLRTPYHLYTMTLLCLYFWAPFSRFFSLIQEIPITLLAFWASKKKEKKKSKGRVDETQESWVCFTRNFFPTSPATLRAPSRPNNESISRCPLLNYYPIMKRSVKDCESLHLKLDILFYLN